MKGIINVNCLPLDYSETFIEGVPYDVKAVILGSDLGEIELPLSDVELLLEKKKKPKKKVHKVLNQLTFL